MGRTGTPLPTPQQPAPAAVCSTSSWRALTSRERRAQRRAAARAWARADPTGRGAVPASIDRTRKSTFRSLKLLEVCRRWISRFPRTARHELVKEGAGCQVMSCGSTEKSRKQEGKQFFSHRETWWEVYYAREVLGRLHHAPTTATTLSIFYLYTSHLARALALARRRPLRRRCRRPLRRRCRRLLRRSCRRPPLRRPRDAQRRLLGGGEAAQVHHELATAAHLRLLKGLG